MNFTEAVNTMKEGKKVEFEGNVYHYKNNQFYRNNDVPVFRIDMSFETNNWEVVEDDKDWKLTDRIYGKTGDGERIYLESSIKKCRDLIKKDFEKHNYAWAWDIVNKRFGEL